MSAQDRPDRTLAGQNGAQLGGGDAGFFELSLIRSVDNVRIALLFLILVVALTAPARMTGPLAVYTLSLIHI